MDSSQVGQLNDRADLVAYLAIKDEDALVSVGCLLVTALQVIDRGEVIQRPGFGKLVTDIAGEGDGLPVMVGSLLTATLFCVIATQGGQRVSFDGAVAATTGGSQS